jgi:hypothetical protein
VPRPERGAELGVVHGEFGPLGLDDSALEKVRAKAAFPRVPRDHADGEGTVLSVDFTGPADPGVVVLNGAAVSFVVLCPATPGS